ncbi:hypothetical protein ACFO26_08110 [Lactococcus nasutitermitis]|uniref:Uncharacterized protein n=1 Tax=Lactococcus nasutitermitis TaxID=1652957 RepID=A0ABV9JDS0_9LACT|nr:hypothetical protein [Lactococcus nasutitermitis]
MEMTWTRASFRRRSIKKKIILATVLLSFGIAGTVFASAQIFVVGGWNTAYTDRFSPTIGQAKGYDNAKINKIHYSWVKLGSKEGVSSVVLSNKISYAKVIGAWNAPLNGWYVKL